jgi:major type 1 subunit fimbrin (pilin)
MKNTHMNKVTKITVFSLLSMAGLSLLSLQPARADDSDSGSIHFEGRVLASTCTLDSKSLQVPMGTVSADAYATAGTTGRPVPFNIDLSNCNAALHGVSVELTGTADATKSDYLSIDSGPDSATGLAIELLDQNDKSVPINSTADEYTINEGANSLAFKAHYVSTADNVTPGDANGTAQFFLKYR